MKINTNTWNKIRYSLYAPGYDIGARTLDNARKESIDALHIKPGDHILIVGAGTGLDLEHLPVGCQITATDITPAMINKILRRNKKFGHHLKALVMDGQKLNFKDQSFDFIILHLVLSVIPDPIACLKEAERTLKNSGFITVFDKFVKDHSKISFGRKLANGFTSLLFSDITRNFGDIVKQTQLNVISDTKATNKGNFRIIQLQKS